jgi:glyoxylate reductase
LATVKRIPEADAYTRAGQYEGWAPELLLGSDLHGKTLGIVGGGRIGSGVAHRMSAGFGMNVIYTDIAPSPALEAETTCEYCTELNTLLTRADVVSLHVPLNDATHHLINAERLALMKPTAYLINTSRGPVVDEQALVEALRTGTIRGAGLDVFEDEPQLAPGLADLPQAVITPHIASASTETRTKMSEIAATNIIAVFRGETAPNIVLS